MRQSLLTTIAVLALCLLCGTSAAAQDLLKSVPVEREVARVDVVMSRDGFHTKVHCAIATTSHVRLTLHTTDGALVRVLHDGEMRAGRQTIQVRHDGLAIGRYIVRAVIGRETIERDMMVHR